MIAKTKKLSILAIIQLMVLPVCVFLLSPAIMAAPTTEEVAQEAQACQSGNADACKAACQHGSANSCLEVDKANKIIDLLEVGLNFLAGAVFLGAVIMLTVAGIEYTSSNGNPQKVESAKKKIYNVIIGLAAFIFLYAFLQWLIPGGNSIL
jgi:hypothetical protein